MYLSMPFQNVFLLFPRDAFADIDGKQQEVTRQDLLFALAPINLSIFRS